MNKYHQLFSGIGKVKVDPIHIHLNDPKKPPVVQKLRPVALHLLEPHRQHKQELVAEGVIEEPSQSDHTIGRVSNMVIASNKWDPSKIRLTLDTRHMEDYILQAHFPFPKLEQLSHRFSGSNQFSVLDMSHVFHQLELDEESSKLLFLPP